jgi:hypothetical protein
MTVRHLAIIVLGTVPLLAVAAAPEATHIATTAQHEAVLQPPLPAYAGSFKLAQGCSSSAACSDTTKHGTQQQSSQNRG